MSTLGAQVAKGRPVEIAKAAREQDGSSISFASARRLNLRRPDMIGPLVKAKGRREYVSETLAVALVVTKICFRVGDPVRGSLLIDSRTSEVLPFVFPRPARCALEGADA